MLYKKFAELKSDYEIITVSPSELESKMVPSMFQMTDERKRFLTLEVWHMCEAIAWAVVSNDSDDMAKHLIDVTRSFLDRERMHFYEKNWKEDKQFLFLYDWLEQLIPLYTPYKNTYDLRNYRTWVEIDFSWYKILLTGEVDFWINWYHLFDNKTSKQRRDLEARRAVNCRQSRFYSRMNMLANDIDKIDFTYLIYVKNKKFILQEMTHTLTRDECEQFVYDKLYQYCLGLKQWTIKDESTVMQRM